MTKEASCCFSLFCESAGLSARCSHKKLFAFHSGDDVLCDGYHQLSAGSAGEMINRLLDTEESLCRAWTQVERTSDQSEEEALNHGTLPKMVERMCCTNLACQKNAPCAAAGREGGPLVSGIIGATSQDVRDILAARKHEPCTLATCTSCAAGQGTRQKVRTFALAPELLRVKLFRKASLDS